MKPLKALVWFLIFEFMLFLFYFVITGTFSVDSAPLQIITDIATSIGTTEIAIGIGLFIIGTFANLATMFLNLAHGDW